METYYNNESCDKLMEKYNFDSPITVTLVIEDEDPPDPFSLKGLLLTNNTDVPNRNVCTNRTNKNSNYEETVLPELNETQDVPWQLLDVVADNLIHITKGYYYNYINNENQVRDSAKLKIEFLNFKHHFFNLSYSTTVTILLPQEYNTQFISKFIRRVIEIANRNSWYEISYNKLEILIRDMLRWTKEKKKHMNIKFGSHSYETMKSPPDIVRKTHVPVQVMNMPNNYRTNNLIQNTTRPLNINPERTDLMQDIANPTSSTNIKRRSGQKRIKCPETLNLQQEIYISPNSFQKTNYSNQRVSSPFNMDYRAHSLLPEITHLPYTGSSINHSAEKNNSIDNNEPKTNNFSSCEAMNKIVVSAGPPNREITISINPQICAKLNQNTNQINKNVTECNFYEEYGTEPMKRRKSNDDQYYNSTNMPHYKNSYSQRKNCSATTFEPHIDEVFHEVSSKTGSEFNTDILRSSVSRDSGLSSPVYESSHNEEMIEPLTNEQTPIISHVTSLNPEAVNLINECCTVCGATTNNVCIECFQQYYCSSLCQNKDWEVHKYYCSAT